MDDRARRWLLGAFVVGLALSITLAETALALLTLRWIWRRATGRAGSPGWPLGLPFLAWIGVSLASVGLSPNPIESLSAARGLLLIATFYVLIDGLTDADEGETFVRALLGLMAVVALVGVMQVAMCPSITPATPVLGRVAGKCHRARGFYSHFMTLAGVLNLVLLATLPRVVAVGSASGRELWPIAAWLAGAVGFAFTYVRGAWIGFVLGIVTLLALVRRGRILTLGAALVLVAVVALVPGVRRRAESIVDPADPTTRERLAMWRSGLEMTRAHPLLGVGPGQVKREYPRYVAPEFSGKSRGHLHNTPLQILVERGLLGLAAWASIFLAFFVRMRRMLIELEPDAAPARAVVAGSMAAIIGFLAAGLTEHNFGDSEVVLVAYVAMALPFVLARRHTPTVAVR